MRNRMPLPCVTRDFALRNSSLQPCARLTLCLTQGWRGQLRKAGGVGYARLQVVDTDVVRCLRLRVRYAFQLLRMFQKTLRAAPARLRLMGVNDRGKI